MVRHSPCELYIKYLVSHPLSYSISSIQKILESKALDALSVVYIESLKTQFLPPIPFRPYDKAHLASQHFLNKHRIYTLYFKDADTHNAEIILRTPKLKEFVEAMILAGAAPELIARGALRIQSDIRLTHSGVKRYKHYFWNTDLLDFTEMRAVLEKRGSGTDSEFNRVHRRDSRKISADMPFSPISALLAQLRMGITPVGVNFSELMERVRTIAGIKTYQYILEDGRWESDKARNYITVAMAATDLLERSVRPEELIIEKFNALHLETDPMPIPHINMLSDGQHTTDLQPIETRDSVVEVDDES